MPKQKAPGPQQLEYKLLEGRDHALFIIWHQSLEQRLARRHGRHAGLSGRESYLYHPASWASSGMFLKASLL